MNFFDLFTLQIDLGFLYELMDAPFSVIVYFFISHGMWVVWAWFFLWASWQMWISWRQVLYAKTRKFVVLAVDVPQDNFQTPKAVENIFSQIHTIARQGNLIDKYWLGKFSESISFELVSIDGYTQFIIRSHKAFRDVIEASIYAQYPEAEITEVADYVPEVPQKYPDAEYDMFGTEIVLMKDSSYPIRTYPDFEDKMSGDIKDPMAAILESLSALQKGEQVWIQIIIYPVFDKDWKPAADDLIKELSGIPKKEKPKPFSHKVFEFPITLIRYIIEELLLGNVPAPAEKKADAPSNLQHLPPGQKNVIEQIERKASKLGFKTCMRLIYVGHKAIFNKGRGFMPIWGALRQFNTQNMNSLFPALSTLTDADYLFANQRTASKQNSLMQFYKSRSLGAGAKHFYLNTEELATLYHFPMATVMSPMMKKTTGRKGESPVNLPRSR